MPELRIEGALNFVGRGGSCGPVGVVPSVRIYHKVMLGVQAGKKKLVMTGWRGAAGHLF